MRHCFCSAFALVCFALLAGCQDETDPSTPGVVDGGATADAAQPGDAAQTGDATDPAEVDTGPAAPSFPAHLAAELQALLDDHYDEVDSPGVVVAVLLPELGLWVGAAGLARKSPEQAMSAGDRQRIGSVTKTFIAATVLQLVQEGVLSLADPIDEWVPGFELGPEITVERVLNHTSGIFNFTDDATFLIPARAPAEPEEVINFALEHEAVFEPGGGWSYSNTNYYLAGLVIEAATGQPLHQVIRERLLQPLELENTWLEGAEEAPGELIDGHTGGVETTDLMDMSWAWAAGGLVSTASDLCTWAASLFAGEVLPAAVVAEMVEPVEASRGAGGYGYGLGIMRVDRGGRNVAGHTGSVMGFRGELFFDLELGVCVAVQSNDFLAEPHRLAERVWVRALEELGIASQ